VALLGSKDQVTVEMETADAYQKQEVFGVPRPVPQRSHRFVPIEIKSEMEPEVGGWIQAYGFERASLPAETWLPRCIDQLMHVRLFLSGLLPWAIR
jgi:hypothetical protein